MELIFTMMVQVDEEIGEDIEGDLNLKARHLLLTVVQNSEESVTLPYLMQLISTSLSNVQDWRYKYAGMTAFSGIPDLLQDTNDLDKILLAVKQHVDPTFHPKIRQAAFYAIGKL